jgi:putative toxin-antitoxin system antitoxin component (TIGR02293 family)
MARTDKERKIKFFHYDKNQRKREGFIPELFPELEPATDDPLLAVDYLRKGISVEYIARFAIASGLTQIEIIRKLRLSPRTVESYKKSGKALPLENGERLLKLIKLYHLGIEVIGSRDSFTSWLKKPAYGLGWIVGFTLLDSITGIEAVMNELTNIAFGAFS